MERIVRVEQLTEGVTLYLADCREVLPTLGLFDAVLTDPPYGVGHVKSNGGKGRHGRRNSYRPIVGDRVPFDPTLLLGHPEVILWGADHYAYELPRGRWLVWDKLDGVAAFDSFSDVEVAWHNRPGAARIIRHRWKGVCKSSENGLPREHPTQKPIAVMEWCIDQLSNGGEHICDPYMGSGTTGVACVRKGKRFTGIEIDPGHFETAIRRVSEALATPSFFTARPPSPAQEALGL
jgi:site-specific DNA-methyltransferase (adenine-specific)